MKRFNSFRAKDPVLAAIISMGLAFAAPAMTRAQSAMGDWEEVGPAGQSAQQQLMSAPPRVAAAPLGQASYRPPVEPRVLDPEAARFRERRQRGRGHDGLHRGGVRPRLPRVHRAPRTPDRGLNGGGRRKETRC